MKPISKDDMRYCLALANIRVEFLSCVTEQDIRDSLSETVFNVPLMDLSHAELAAAFVSLKRALFRELNQAHAERSAGVKP